MPQENSVYETLAEADADLADPSQTHPRSTRVWLVTVGQETRYVVATSREHATLAVLLSLGGEIADTKPRSALVALQQLIAKLSNLPRTEVAISAAQTLIDELRENVKRKHQIYLDK